MEILIPTRLVEEAIKETSSDVLTRVRDETMRFRTIGRFLTVPGHQLDKKTLKFLYEATKDKDAEYSNNIEFLYKALKKPSNIKIQKMNDVEVGLRSYLNSMKDGKRYLFDRGPFKSVKPYLITKIDSGKRVGYRKEDILVVTLHMMYLENEESHSKVIVFSPDTLCEVCREAGIGYERIMKVIKARNKDEDDYEYLQDVLIDDGLPIDQLLSHNSLFLETEELHDLYDKQFARYVKYVKMYGAQFRVRGIGELASNSYWGGGDSSMLVDGKPGRVIMNTVPRTILAEEEESNHSRRSSRRRYYNDDDDGEASTDGSDKLPSNPLEIRTLFEDIGTEDFEKKTKVDWPKMGEEMVVPVHPVLCVYHLHKMENYLVHANNLREYEYQENMEDQLVLDQDLKDMVKMMVLNSSRAISDVVEGKSQSTIIGLVGDPGLGKTLTAEVISESCKKPLYKIQAAQLGEDAATLEKRLQKILNRAQRWNAVLMIDEANAYIHERGHDMAQNSIVGVFLRLMEYYHGVMIVTTNLTSGSDQVSGYDIDAAIAQRMARIFVFQMPSKKLAHKLWRVQAKLVGAEINDELYEQLVTTYDLSGRTIRNMLRGALDWAEFKKRPLSFADFKATFPSVPKTPNEGIRSTPSKKEETE